MSSAHEYNCKFVQQQEQEVGDGTNFVMVFAGALLEQAESLLRMVCYLVVV
jgi:chaperonin GroEL (HSP60 family)